MKEEQLKKQMTVEYILNDPLHILTLGLQWGGVGVGGGPHPEDNAVWGHLGIVNLGNSPFYGQIPRLGLYSEKRVWTSTFDFIRSNNGTGQRWENGELHENVRSAFVEVYCSEHKTHNT